MCDWTAWQATCKGSCRVSRGRALVDEDVLTSLCPFLRVPTFSQSNRLRGRAVQPWWASANKSIPLGRVVSTDPEPSIRSRFTVPRITRSRPRSSNDGGAWIAFPRPSDSTGLAVSQRAERDAVVFARHGRCRSSSCSQPFQPLPSSSPLCLSRPRSPRPSIVRGSADAIPASSIGTATAAIRVRPTTSAALGPAFYRTTRVGGLELALFVQPIIGAFARGARTCAGYPQRRRASEQSIVSTGFSDVCTGTVWQRCLGERGTVNSVSAATHAKHQSTRRLWTGSARVRHPQQLCVASIVSSTGSRTLELGHIIASDHDIQRSRRHERFSCTAPSSRRFACPDIHIGKVPEAAGDVVSSIIRARGCRTSQIGAEW